MSLALVHLFVMSRCPDAARCEVLFTDALVKLLNAGAATAKIDYIGNGTSVDTFTCMHGTDECIGNMQQLCVGSYNGTQTQLAFAKCEDTMPSNSRIPHNAPDCAAATGAYYGGDACSAAGGLGERLLAASFATTQDAGVEISCTVQLADSTGALVVPGCNVNDGVWDPSCSALGVDGSGSLDTAAFFAAVCNATSAAGKKSPLCS